MQEEPKVKSLQKALNVLDCFSSRTPDLGVSEIARILGLNKSNVHNILSTLEDSGYVRKDAQSGKYMLGNKMLEFSYTVMSTYKHTNAILPAMVRLANELDTVIYFGIPHGKSVLYMFVAYPSEYASGIPYRSIMGETAPFYCTSIGKALLMAMKDDEIKKRIDEPKIKYTPNTLVEEKTIMLDIDKSRKRGYAIDNAEHEPNVRCVGIPVIDRKMTLIGSISASGHSSSIPIERTDEIAKKLLATAFSIRGSL